MTYLVERLAELKRYLDHLAAIRPRVTGRAAIERDMSLRNDVLFSLLSVCQLVVDIAGELSARRGERFEDYTEAVRNLRLDERFPADLVEQLSSQSCSRSKAETNNTQRRDRWSDRQLEIRTVIEPDRAPIISIL